MQNKDCPRQSNFDSTEKLWANFGFYYQSIFLGVFLIQLSTAKSIQDLVKHVWGKVQNLLGSPPDPNASPFLEHNYLFCNKMRHFNWLEDVSPNGYAEGPVDPFCTVWMASKIKQHLHVVKLGWILLAVSKQPKEKLSHKKEFQPERKRKPSGRKWMHRQWRISPGVLE